MRKIVYAPIAGLSKRQAGVISLQCDPGKAGMLLVNSNTTIVQCVFHDNDASLDGGAVANVKDGGGAAGSPIIPGQQPASGRFNGLSDAGGA